MSIANKITSRIKGESSLVLIDQAIFSGNAFISTALLARFLGIDGFGVYSSIVLGIYLLMSMSNAIILQPMQVALHQFEDTKSYQGFNLGTQIILSIALLIAVFVASILGVGESFRISGNTLILAGLMTIVWLTHDFFRKLFLATQNIKNTIVVDCIMASIQLVGLIGLGVAHQLTLDTAIILTTLSFTISSVIAWLLSEIKLKHISYNATYFKYHKNEGSFLFLSAILQWWSSNLFVVSSGLFLGAAALGAFRLVQSMFGVLNLLLQTYENYVLPKAARLFTISKVESQKYISLITKKGGVLFALFLIPLFIFSQQAIALFGGVQYEDYDFIIKGMVILYAIIYLGYSVRMPIRIQTLNSAFFIGYCISFIFSLLTFKILLQEFGISGAIAGLIINQLLMISYWKYKLTTQNLTT